MRGRVREGGRCEGCVCEGERLSDGEGRRLG